eukprot:4682327-Ditylum_brightwellii.AAC.1
MTMTMTTKEIDNTSYLHDNTYHFCWKGILNSTKSDQCKLWPCWPLQILASRSGSSFHFYSASHKATTLSRYSYHLLCYPSRSYESILNWRCCLQDRKRMINAIPMT